MEHFENTLENESVKRIADTLSTIETKEQFEELLDSQVPREFFDKLGKEKVLEAFLYLCSFATDGSFSKDAFMDVTMMGTVDSETADWVLGLLIKEGLLVKEGDRFKISNPNISDELTRILSQYDS
jgi:hypothetical protein